MSTKTLQDNFDEFRWTSPPPSAMQQDGALIFKTGENTDYWQRTFYGFRRDDAHVFALPVKGDFDATCSVKFTPNSIYDQAGIAVRKDASTWLKASIEDNGANPALLGCVVTNHGYSDWSMRDYAGDVAFMTYQIERRSSDITVFAKREDQKVREMLRLSHLHGVDDDCELYVGPYACSPEGPGCDVVVSDFTLHHV